MIRNSYLGCQYRDLRTKFHRRWIEHPSLVRQRADMQLKTWRSGAHCTSGRLPRIVSVTLYACVREQEPQCLFVSGMNGHEGAGKAREFVTTRWSLILSATHFGSEEQGARDALAELCRTYWRPIFSFVRGRGYSIEDAQDLTQDFFVTILKNGWLHNADRNRGRFRSLLLKSLQNFLINAAEKTHAHKRGGDVEFVSWDDWMAEAPSQLSIPVQALDSLPPERIFDLTWATTVVEHAFQRLREECEGKGKLWLFNGLCSNLTY